MVFHFILCNIDEVHPYYPIKLTQMINIPTQILGSDSHSPALMDLFISSDVGICSTMVFSPLRDSDNVVVSVSIDFPSNSQ